jgi:hypothetical protein
MPYQVWACGNEGNSCPELFPSHAVCKYRSIIFCFFIAVHKRQVNLVVIMGPQDALNVGSLILNDS